MLIKNKEVQKKLIRVGVGFYIPANNISFVGVNETIAIKRKIKKLKSEERFLDLSRNKKTKAIVFYTDSSGVEHGIASTFEVDTILKKIEDKRKEQVQL